MGDIVDLHGRSVPLEDDELISTLHGSPMARFPKRP